MILQFLHNLLYFQYPFNAKDTKPQPFYDEDGKLIGNVPMMTQQSPFRYANFDSLNATFVELPYGAEDRLAMLLIVPYPKAKISQILQHFGRFDIEQIHKEVYKYDDFGDVVINLPKFEIDSNVELRSILQHLGIKDIFDRSKAKLSKMSKEPIFISHVYHKAILKVNEIGAVASATSFANAVDFAFPLEYNLNRPFGFMITERTTHTLLFAGQVQNPLA